MITTFKSSVVSKLLVLQLLTLVKHIAPRGDFCSKKLALRDLTDLRFIQDSREESLLVLSTRIWRCFEASEQCLDRGVGEEERYVNHVRTSV